MSRWLFMLLMVPFLPDPVDWAVVARNDAEHAIEYVSSTHPGLAAEIQDPATLSSIAAARKFKDQRSRTVRDHASYVDFMRTLANLFQDPHIQWLPMAQNVTQSERSLEIHAEANGRILWLHLRRLSYPDRDILLRATENAHRYSAVVVDLRDNQGGDSRVGDILLGLFPAPRRPIMSPECPIAWRASSTTLAWTENERAKIALSGSTDSQYFKHLEKASEDIRASLKAKSGLTSSFAKSCLERHRPKDERAAVSRHVMVITDSRCYSSCLLTVEKLRLNGALHFGAVTRQGNWYMDVATTTLPSKLGRFSTVQRVDLRRSYQLGPFAPDIRDTCSSVETGYRECVANLIIGR